MEDAVQKPKHIEQQKNMVCFHCGDQCKRGVVQHDDKSFCCIGCKTVYDILSSNDLDAYYAMSDRPGIRPETKREALSAIEHDDILKRFILFHEKDVVKIRLTLPSIHCSSCIWLLENIHELIPDVVSCRVNFPNRKADITIKGDYQTVRKVIYLINDIGYTPDIHQDSSIDNKDKTYTQDRQLIYKIGVAGFCFGNIMLLSFPEYLSIENPLESHWKWLFNSIMIALSLPVVLYSASQYFYQAIKSVEQRFLNINVPIALGIVALFSRSLWEILFMQEAGYLDSLSGLVFFLLVGKWFQQKTYHHLSFERNMHSFFPLALLVQKEREFVTTPLSDIKEGDIVMLRNEEILPADGVLLSDTASFDYSFVTGESYPIQKNKEDTVYTGGKLTGSHVLVRIQNPVSQHDLNQLWSEDRYAKKQENKLLSFIDQVSHRFTLVVIAIAVLSSILWAVFSDIGKATEIFTSVLIVACPCALALAAPFTYGNAMRMLAREKAYLKSSSVIEQMAKCDHLVFDKTGTLTENYQAKITYTGTVLTNLEKATIKAVTKNSIHPLSKMLYEHIDSTEYSAKPETYIELPGKGIQATINNDEIHIGSLSFLKESNVHPATMPVSGQYEYTCVHISVNYEYKGMFIYSNVYRSGIFRTLNTLNKQRAISILSGDSDQEKKTLEKELGTRISYLFHQSPDDKKEYIHSLQQKNNVMMLGDGVNDALALEQSHVGVAVTDNLSSFSPASDIIFHASSLSKLPGILSFSEGSVRILYISLGISLFYNLVGLTFAISGQLTPLVAAILMPLSSISIVLFTVFSTTLLAKWKFT